MHHKHFAPASIRNFIFGVEDSLVSTVGLLSGIAVAGVPRTTIVLTGFVLIAVEGISMAVGSFLSEGAAEEAENHTESDKVAGKGAVVMFFSYILAGFIPLIPYMFSNQSNTIYYSIAITCLGLILLGTVSARLFGTSVLKSTLRFLILGGGAIAVGIVVGQLLPTGI